MGGVDFAELQWVLKPEDPATEAVERKQAIKARSRQRKARQLERLGHRESLILDESTRKRRRPPPGAFAVDPFEAKQTQEHETSKRLSRAERASALSCSKNAKSFS